MADGFAAWKMLQDNMLAVQRAQIEAATKLMGMGEGFDGAAKAAQQVAEANVKAWESWMAMWGVKK
jgi:hypothetical protein